MEYEFVSPDPIISETSAGSYDVTIETWRPVTPSPACEMRRYFIGGTPQLEDLAYAGKPNLHSGEGGGGGANKGGGILSKYGNEGCEISTNQKANGKYP